VKNFFKRFLRNKRAITPVLSELLLTVIVVAAMSVATTATYVITTNLRENMSERVIVEDVWFQATGTVNVTLQNVGKVDVSISSAYINHTSQHPSLRLGIGDNGGLVISYNWTSRNLYYIDIVTNRGLHIAGYYKAP
jgi:hypothetical protein